MVQTGAWGRSRIHIFSENVASFDIAHLQVAKKGAQKNKKYDIKMRLCTVSRFPPICTRQIFALQKRSKRSHLQILYESRTRVNRAEWIRQRIRIRRAGFLRQDLASGWCQRDSWDPLVFGFCPSYEPEPRLHAFVLAAPEAPAD